MLGERVQRRDVFFDITSGSKTAVSRPGMKRLLEYAESGDTASLHERVGLRTPLRSHRYVMHTCRGTFLLQSLGMGPIMLQAQGTN